ncbi:MAG TPA: ATPase, T2SS/T4P/T4SS family [archaeon]|nr:ATPase, T2SS/T4P/T4SS family [archaeon]
MTDKLLKEYSLESDGMKIGVKIVYKEGDYVRSYMLDIPAYGAGTKALLDNLKRTIIMDASIKAEKLLDPKFIEYLKTKFREKAEKFLEKEIPTIEKETENSLIAILLHEMLGLGKIEFFLADGDLEEIVVNNSKDPVWVYHKEYNWLKTNVTIDTEDEIQNYASIIARRGGKQITILTPLLDTHLVTGDRANATLFPISGKGNTITIRRFRRDPWTVTDFIRNKTANSEVMALIWMCMQYELNIVLSGGTASGKTSFMNICLPFIQPNQRVITIEDSVSGESEIIYQYNGKTVKSTVGGLIDGIIEDDSIESASVDNEFGIGIPTMSETGKIEWKEPSHFIRHWVKKDLLTITLKSGREIKVTPDHSLFSLNENGKIAEISGKQLEEGIFLATPRICDWQGQKIVFDLREKFDAFEGCFVKSIEISPLLKNNPAILEGFDSGTVRAAIKRNSASMQMIMAVGITPKTGWISSRLGTKIPLDIEIDAEFSRFIGMWLADGSYDKNSVIVSIVEPEARETVESIAARFGLKTKMHSDGISLMINSKPLKHLLQNVLGLDGNAYTKKMPNWVFNLGKKESAAILNGYFSGDGWVRKNDIAVRSSSPQLLKDTGTFLLKFGIPLRVKWKKLKDKTFEARISGAKFLKKYVQEIGFCINKKNLASEKWITTTNHDVSDVVPLPKHYYREIKKALKQEVGKTRTYKGWKSYNYSGNMGRETLQKIVSKYGDMLPKELGQLAFNDVFWDPVEKISRENFEGFVYDFSVPGNESFIANNIVCHNTRELSLPEFLHWVPMTTREPNAEGKGGVSMLNLLINSLRQRPDRIIVGETRRREEAEVMFEAMHTGHSVYTTFHANTADETIRRFTNPPIDIPPTVLDSVHLNVVMFRNRRLGLRRILQVAEFVPEKRGSQDTLKANTLYRWRPNDDAIVKDADSIRLFDELSMHTGMTYDEIKKDLEKKKKILDWLVKNDIHNVNDVGKVMARYYLDENEIVKLAEGNKKFDSL